MHLTKWYMDLVTEDGEVCLGYAATLRLYGLPLAYSAILEGSRNRPFFEYHALRGLLPKYDNRNLRWRNDALGVQGVWHRLGAIQPEPLVLDAQGERNVVWHNVAPRAQVEIRTQNGIRCGFGYAECLTMTLPPWQLGMRRLRWGRFVAETHALAWIEWTMSSPHGEDRRWLLVEGQPQQGFLLEPERLAWDGGELLFGADHVIRDGVIRDTALADTPWLRFLLPDRVCGIHEVKRFAPGTLRMPDGHETTGWVIDEYVHFGE